MRTKLLSLIILAATIIVSCQKEQVNLSNNSRSTASVTVGSANALEGKWQQTSLELYMLDPAGKKLYDTIYTKPFTADDYAQIFYSGNKCALSISHYFYMPAPGTATATPTPISPLVNILNITKAGTNFTLTTQGAVQGPGGGSVADTLSAPGNNTLLVHTVATFIGPNKYVTDSYYTRTSGN